MSLLALSISNSASYGRSVNLITNSLLTARFTLPLKAKNVSDGINSHANPVEKERAHEKNPYDAVAFCGFRSSKPPKAKGDIEP